MTFKRLSNIGSDREPAFIPVEECGIDIKDLMYKGIYVEGFIAPEGTVSTAEVNAIDEFLRQMEVELEGTGMVLFKIRTTNMFDKE